jgi:hypothetical protein
MTMPASPRERTLYRITYKLLGSHPYFGQWSEEDLEYPKDGGPNGWVLSGLECVPSADGALLVAHWCRVDPCDVETSDRG